MTDVQNGHKMHKPIHKDTTINLGGQGNSQGQGQGGQGQSQSKSGGQGQQSQGQGGSGGKQYPTEDVMMGVDVNVPYDQNVAGDPHGTLWDHMSNAVKPDLTPNKNYGNGVLGTMDVKSSSKGKGNS